MTRLLTVLALTAALCVPLAAGAATPSRSGWIVDRALSDAPTLDRAALPQSDIGGTVDMGGVEDHGGPPRLLKPMALSLLLPGLGEASMGYKRGYLMMALDAAAWFGVAKYHQDGKDKRQLYYDYLDAHWSETDLEDAFGSSQDGVGTFYYGVEHHTDLSLWVSRDEDEREYYENAGKWDQFVFGWDDFIDPRILYPDITIYPGETSYLRDNPNVSQHRMIYRDMRQDSNDAFHTRDNLIYFNMLTRVFSVLQVAWLGGAFSDDGQAALSVGGHDVAIIAEPRGFTASRLGFSVSY